MTQNKVEITGDGLVNATSLPAKIGLDKHAYVGAPRGVAQYSWREDAEPLLAEDHWSFKSKKRRKQEIIDNL